MKKFVLFILLFPVVLTSCGGAKQLSASARWAFDAKTGYVTDQAAPIAWKFKSVQMNASDCSYAPMHFVAADSLAAYSGRRFVESVLHDMPFRLDSLAFVYADFILVGEMAGPIDLKPDYVIYDDSATWTTRSEVYQPTKLQGANEVWRNLVYSKAHHRVLCVDRFHIGGRYMVAVYVEQSRCKALRRWGVNGWCNLPSWEATDKYNIVPVANFVNWTGFISSAILADHSKE